MHSQIFQPSAAPMLYTWHFRKLFAIFTSLKTTFRIAKNLLHPFLKVDIYVHWKVTKHSAFTFLQICQVQRSIYLHLTMDSNSFWYLIWIFLLSYTVSKKNCLKMYQRRNFFEVFLATKNSKNSKICWPNCKS